LARRIMPWKIFVAALVVRWVYAIAIFALLGDAGLQTIDSTTYVVNAHDFAAQIASGSLSGLQWLGPVNNTMPLFQWLAGLCAVVFGPSMPLGYVLLQGIVDAATCLLVYGMARTMDDAYAAPAGIAAAINPTQIVMSGLILTDPPFLFFSALFLLATVRWLRAPTWAWAALIGVALGAATMTRVLAAPFAVVLLLFLLMVCLIRKQLSRRLTSQLVGAALIFTLCLAPVIWRNVSQYGTWALTPQSGVHLALWVVPLTQEAVDGTPWSRSYDNINRRVAERYGAPAADPFEQSRRYETIARERLAALGPRAIAKAWLTGAAINLGSPAIILSPPVLNLPRTGFYGTLGTSPLDKVKNFLFHSDNATYAWILLAGITGVMAVRLAQLVGVAVLWRQGHIAVLFLFALWIAYVLAVDGPVASPKYRLPVEVPLMVLTGASLSLLLRRFADHEHHPKRA
jgi:Dolichyl-phosphate-mannose-protein mannosyltransferase